MAGAPLSIFYIALTYTAFLALAAGTVRLFLTRHGDGQKRSPKYLGILAASLVFTALTHLRFVLNPIPNWLQNVQGSGVWGECLLPVFALFFLAFGFRDEGKAPYKKLMVTRICLVLLFLTAISGWAASYMRGSSVPDAKGFFRGVLGFHFRPVDPHPLFLVHYTIFLALAALLPFAGLKRIYLAAFSIILITLLIAARHDPGPQQGRVTETFVRQYHAPIDYWLRNHGWILSETSDFSMGECRNCHRASFCNNCHVYIGAGKIKNEE